MFMLSSTRKKPKGLPAYREYLWQNKDKFPPDLFEWIICGLYYDFDSHLWPHDAWLESFTFKERATSERDEIRKLGLEVKLLCACSDHYITLTYSNIRSYKLSGIDMHSGFMLNCHCDWIMDEYRISKNGLLIHEIEWAGHKTTARWLIECEDIALKIDSRKS